MRCLLLLLALPLAAQESTVEIDNAWVKVLRMKLAPRAKLRLQDHPPTVIVFLAPHRPAKIAVAGTAGILQVSDTGEAVYTDAASYEEDNPSDQTLEQIVVELKPNAPKSPPISLDPVKLDAEHHLVPLENARVRILRTILEPHLKSPMHEHPHYVVVYLTELHTTMALSDGKLIDNVRRPGEVAWRDYMKHQTENIGDKQAVEIQIELK